jgi:heme/copper-type cytochrome/quinol oxidase subunit 4
MSELDLINWQMIGKGILWIGGLAILLTAFGFAYYQARSKSQPLRTYLRKAAIQAWLNLGMFFFSSGMLATAASTLEMILWALLAVTFLTLSVLSFRQVKRRKGRV